MRRLIRYSMNNGVALLFVVALLIGGGFYSLNSMKKEKYPNVDIPFLTVQMIYPGASPSQIMDEFGRDAEAELNRLDHIDKLYVTAEANAFVATMGFKMGVDMDKAEQAARAALGKVNLPSAVKDVKYYKDQLDGDLYTVAVSGTDQAQVQSFVNDLLLPAYRSVNGIDRLDVNGVYDRQIYVNLREADVLNQGLTDEQIKATLATSSLSVPIGSWTTADQNLPLRVGGGLESLAQIDSIRIKAAHGSISLSDVATVSWHSNVDHLATLNGKPASYISVFGKGGYDTVTLVKDLKAAQAKLALPQGLAMEVTLNRTEEIRTSVNTMLREVLLGAAMAVLVTLLFLRNLRSTLIAVISIPLSMFASLLILKQLGYSLNIMTLSGIAVAIGRVVDDSIVVIENIFRRIRRSKERGDPIVEDATNEVSRAITSSTLTTIAVFLPMAFVPGIVGAFFQPLAWTIVISLLFSLLVAITIVPLLSRMTLLKVKHKEFKESGIQLLYRRMLRWSLAHRFVTLMLATVLLLGSLAIALTGQLGFNFLPSEPSREFTVELTMPEGSNLETTNKIATQVEAIVKKQPSVERIGLLVNTQSAFLTFTVNEDEQDTGKIAEGLRDSFNGIKEAKSITITGEDSIGIGNGLMIIVNGPDSATINAAGDQMVEALKSVTGLEDVHHSGQGEKPEAQFVANENKLADAGLNNGLVAQAMNRVIQGETVATASIDGRSSDIVLRSDSAPADHAPLSTLDDIQATNLLGSKIRLGDVGRWQQVLNPSSISRLNQKEYVELFATITDSNTGGVTADAEKKLDTLKLPAGVTWEAVGASKELNDGFVNMGLALGISIFLVYLVMLLSFGEARTPFVILFSIPFSLIGALGGLWAVGDAIGMPAMIGLLMLNGIVVTNAIVLLERVRDNLKQGQTVHHALLEAGVTRLRPILMTAIATMGALFPLTLSTEAGLVSRSLAVVVIGGLASSTLLTLIIVPILYSLFHGRTKKAGISETVPSTYVA
jgi:multidrug efflux pump subunit AcrB